MILNLYFVYIILSLAWIPIMYLEHTPWGKQIWKEEIQQQ